MEQILQPSLEEKQAILEAALPLVVRLGWRAPLLCEAALAAGTAKEDLVRLFPRQEKDLALFFVREKNAVLLRGETNPLPYGQKEMPKGVQGTIASLVLWRLFLDEAHKEPLRQLAMQLPLMPILATKMLYETMDAIWKKANFPETGFDFYSKRMILAPIYVATRLTWLEEEDPQKEKTKHTLESLLAQTKHIGAWKRKLAGWFGSKDHG